MPEPEVNRNPRILVCGSRDFREEWLVHHHLQYGPSEGWGIMWTLVHGACPQGPDRWADEWAKQFGVPCERHPADWTTYGKRAGFVRNAEMVATLDPAHADYVLAFWDGESKGTKHTIDLALKAKINIEVIFS